MTSMQVQKFASHTHTHTHTQTHTHTTVYYAVIALGNAHSMIINTSIYGMFSKPHDGHFGFCLKQIPDLF